MAPEATPLAPPATPKLQPRRVYAGISESDFDLSTLPDPRSRSITPANVDGDASPRQIPDHNDEVAALSSKLIHAINHQTTLDDSLSQTRVELERAREQIQSLEVQLAKQREMLVGDIWVRRKSVEAEKTNLLSRIAEEKRLRVESEQEKRRIEQELENLTAELFEEANKMVISAKEDARKEQEVLLRKNDLLKAQLADTEGLLKSQQEQLTELKHVMEQMGDHDNETATTTPSSPGCSKFDPREADTPTSDLGSQSGLSDLISPSYPTSFTHLLQPVLRTDINAYEDFVNLCQTSKRSYHSRPPSGSQTGLGIGLMGPVASVTSLGIPSSTSTVSLSSTGSQAPSSTFSHQPPHTPGSSFSGASPSPMVAIPALKEVKFYKRVLVEDVEPTLRLDLAPGLSWLARRSVISAMSDGSLVVEPVPTTGTYARLSQPQLYPCSLCGENRKEEQYLRMYRFRTSESSSSQRYPLCRYCLNRVRSTCDFLGFLRIIKDGHWRTDDEDAEKLAWEESVRLRENMFWARIGGGVRPISQGFHGHSNSVVEKSPRQSQEKSRHQEKEVVVTAEEPHHEDKAIATNEEPRREEEEVVIRGQESQQPEEQEAIEVDVTPEEPEGSRPEEKEVINTIEEPRQEEKDEVTVDESDESDVQDDASESDPEDYDSAEEFASPAQRTPQARPVPQPTAAEEAVDVADVPVVVQDEPTDESKQPDEVEPQSEVEVLREVDQTAVAGEEGKAEANLQRPQTPPPSDSNRLSSQSLTPKSSGSNKRITLRIPGFS